MDERTQTVGYMFEEICKLYLDDCARIVLKEFEKRKDKPYWNDVYKEGLTFIEWSLMKVMRRVVNDRMTSLAKFEFV